MLVFNRTLRRLMAREGFSTPTYLYLAHTNMQNLSSVQQGFLNMFTAKVITNVLCMLLVLHHDTHCYVIQAVHFTP
jgi:hypothetical protein